MKNNKILVLLRKIIAFRKKIFTDIKVELPYDLNKTQRGVLMFVAFEGPISMNKVSEKFSLEKGSFTQIADFLENYALIERKRCEKDRRIIYLETTEKGKEIALKIHQATEKRINSLLSALSEKERTDFLNSLEHISGYIDVILKGNKE